MIGVVSFESLSLPFLARFGKVLRLYDGKIVLDKSRHTNSIARKIKSNPHSGQICDVISDLLRILIIVLNIALQ